jgi:hypothetical protein
MIIRASPLECGSFAAAFVKLLNTGIKAKAAAELPHSKGLFDMLAFPHAYEQLRGLPWGKRGSK